MRGVSLWGAVSGVEKTVFESVEYDQDQDLVAARVRSTKRGDVVVVCACGRVLAMTVVMVGGSGGRWTWAWSRRCWRPTLSGCSAAGMGWWLLRCRGLVMAPGIRTRSMTRWRG